MGIRTPDLLHAMRPGTSADQHLWGVTSEKANTEQRRATQNNARTRRSATQRATRSPEQSNLLPRAEPIRHGQTRQLHHTAAETTTLAERPRSQSLRGPQGPTPPGPDPPAHAEK